MLQPIALALCVTMVHNRGVTSVEARRVEEDTMACQICNKKDDLFAEVTQEPACSICVLRFNLGSPISRDSIRAIRSSLGLEEGMFLEQDHGALAREMLGR